LGDSLALDHPQILQMALTHSRRRANDTPALGMLHST